MFRAGDYTLKEVTVCGQKYVDAPKLHLYVIVEHLVLSVGFNLTASPPPGTFYTSFCNLAAGICSHSASSSSDTDVGW